MFCKYDKSKWAIYFENNSLTSSLLLNYLQKELLPFPQSIYFNQTPEEKEKLLIYCQQICPITNKNNKSTFFNILSDISAQITHYENNNYTFIGFDETDILEIQTSDHEYKYIILSDTYLCKIHPYNKKETQLVYLSKSPQFCNQEIKTKVFSKQFPMLLHAKCGYYGFGKYMEYIYENQLVKNKSIKIMGFLQRCFDPDEDAKQILYI